MKAVLQRVIEARVTVDEQIVGKIGKGYLIFLGVGRGDGEREVKLLAKKIVDLRVMSDLSTGRQASEGKFNKSIIDTSGEILVVSQFTLYADLSEGRRPAFFAAAESRRAEELYLRFIRELGEQGIKDVKAGKFGAYMQVELVNDGPVTIILDTSSL